MGPHEVARLLNPTTRNTVIPLGQESIIEPCLQRLARSQKSQNVT